MLNKISDKTDAIDWAGCIPGIGTVVGLVEMVYNFGLLTFSMFAKKNDPQITAARGEFDSLAKNLLDKPDKPTEAHQKTEEVGRLIKDCRNLHNKWEMSIKKYDENTDLIAKKCLTGMLRATWVGAIGICTYKLLKKTRKI